MSEQVRMNIIKQEPQVLRVKMNVTSIIPETIMVKMIPVEPNAEPEMVQVIIDGMTRSQAEAFLNALHQEGLVEEE
jgi:hypothetical protein